MDRLAALIVPPRRHRHRYSGVLASNAPQRKAVTALAAQSKPALVEAGAVAEETPAGRAVRYARAMRLARLDEVFPLICPKCGSMMRIIAFINDGEAIREVLLHLGEPIVSPKLAPACGPPLREAAGERSTPPAQLVPEARKPPDSRRLAGLRQERAAGCCGAQGKISGNARLTMGSKSGDTRGRVVGFPILG